MYIHLYNTSRPLLFRYYPIIRHNNPTPTLSYPIPHFPFFISFFHFSFPSPSHHVLEEMYPAHKKGGELSETPALQNLLNR